MLNDLETRDNSEEKKIKKAPPPKEPSQPARKTEFVKTIHKPKFYIVSFITLIALFAIIMFIKNPPHLGFFKPSASATHQKENHSIASVSATTPVVKNKEVVKQSLQTSASLHNDYMKAIDDINEGKVQLAMKKLQVIIKEDPDFAPARHVYKNLVSRYGVK